MNAVARASVVRLDHVTKRYRMGDVEVPALADVNLDVFAGEMLVVLGASGSGKSTLVHMLGGLDVPTEGHVWADSLDLAHASERDLTQYRRTRVGIVFQFFNLISTLTALENVQVATEIACQPRDPAKALRIVGLAERTHSFPSQLSGGQQQRVAIARAIAGNPPLLLCDEPTGNLDSHTGRQVLELLVSLCRDLHHTVVIISHHRAIARLADRVAELRDGRIVSIETNDAPARVAEVQW